MSEKSETTLKFSAPGSLLTPPWDLLWRGETRQSAYDLEGRPGRKWMDQWVISPTYGGLQHP